MLKTSIKKNDLRKMVEKEMNLMGQGDITDKYSDMMFADINKEDIKVSKDKDNIGNIIKNAKDKIVELNISELSASPKNCYEKLTGEKRDEMIASLKAYGQINPIIIRPKESVEGYKELIENRYEILVGHTRVDCIKQIQEEEKKEILVKAIIVNCDDVEATLLIAQSNIQREKVSELEIARAYKNTYEALKKDKNTNLKNVEIPINSSKSQNGTSDRTDEVVAQKYGISKNTLRRKMALAYCIGKIVELYSKRKINQEQIQYLSKLPKDVQEQVVDVMKELKIDMSKDMAKKIVEVYEREKNKINTIHSFSLNILRGVMSESAKEEGSKAKGKKVVREDKKEKVYKKDMYFVEERYFPENVEDKGEYILKALEYIKKHKIVL